MLWYEVIMIDMVINRWFILCLCENKWLMLIVKCEFGNKVIIFNNCKI